MYSAVVSWAFRTKSLGQIFLSFRLSARVQNTSISFNGRNKCDRSSLSLKNSSRGGRLTLCLMTYAVNISALQVDLWTPDVCCPESLVCVFPTAFHPANRPNDDDRSRLACPTTGDIALKGHPEGKEKPVCLSSRVPGQMPHTTPHHWTISSQSSSRHCVSTHTQKNNDNNNKNNHNKDTWCTTVISHCC